MSIQEFKPVKEGKVREVYDNGDSLIIVATDRISAFDVILKNKITQKGAILTKMSKFWFDFTKDIVPNHMLSTEVADMPEFFQTKEFDGNSMKCKKLKMLPPRPEKQPAVFHIPAAPGGFAPGGAGNLPKRVKTFQSGGKGVPRGSAPESQPEQMKYILTSCL